MINTKPTVTAINAFNDNYIWAISNKHNNNVALVDPGDADVCITFLQQHNVKLSDILITHHHSDHIGGVKKLLQYAKNKNWKVTVYGPATENISHLDITLEESDVVKLTAVNCQFNVFDLPGHTKGHIAYYTNDLLFCGDTLFSAGCGRVFEGTPEQMYQSLCKLATLPDHTLIYCAHEYTQANVAFALAVEPNNVELQNYAELVKESRNQNKATIPSNIGLERQINPFLRSHELTIKKAADNYSKQKTCSDSDVFTAIRAWKDNV